MSVNITSSGFKRWTLRLMLAMITLLFLLGLALYVLLGTTSGNRWLLAAATQAEPRLTATLKSGTLLGEATLSDVSWSSPGIDIMIPQLDWRWDWNCLRDDTLCLDLLRAQGGSVILTKSPTVDKSRNDIKNGDLQLPLAIAVRNVQLQQTRFEIYGHEIILEKLLGAARLDDDNLQVSSLKLSDLLVAIASSPDVLNEEAVEPKTLILPEISLPLTIQLDDFELERARIRHAEAEYQIQRLQLAAGINGSKVTVTRLEITTQEATFHGKGRIDLRADYPLELDADIELFELPPMTGLKSELSVTGGLSYLFVDLTLQGPVTGALTAHAGLLDPVLPFSVELSWQDFNWPIEQPSVHSRQGSLKAGGSLAGYSFELSGDAGGDQIPDLSLTANGHGSADQIQLNTLKLKALGGTAELSGDLRWSDGVIWQGALQLQQINPAELLIELPGRLNGNLEHSLQVNDEGWALHLSRIAIAGDIAEQPFRLQGAVQGDQSGTWQFAQLLLNSGKNSLQIDGHLGEESALRGTLDIVDLQTSIAQATGSASGLITISGQREAMHLKYSLTAQNVTHAGNTVGTLETGGALTFDTQHLTRPPEGSVQIKANELTFHGYSFTQLEAEYGSVHDTQNLSLDLQGEIISVQSRLKGRLADNTWTGELQKSRLNTPFGDWRLDEALDLTYDLARQSATIGRHCWRADPATLCLNETAEIGKVGQLNISLTDYSSRQTTGLLPDQFSWQGRLAGNAEAQWDAEQKPRIKVDLSAGSGRIGFIQDGQTVQGDYLQLTMHVLFDEKQKQASLVLRSDQFGQADVRLQLPLDQKEPSIESEFHLTGFQMNILHPLLEPLDELAGTLEADGKISGSVKRPRINGKVILRNGRLLDDSLASEIAQVNLQLDLEGYQADLSGDLLLGSGKAELAGVFTWEQQPMTGWLSLKGERNNISFEPELDLLISPDLRLDLLENQLAVTGKIRIPYGRAKIRKLPQEAVGISEDVVILDKPKPSRAQQALPLTLNIEVSLHDDVEIDAFGLKANLEGSLALKQALEKPLTGNGSIDLRDGTYRAFGQNLLIKKGVLLFSGPLSKPYIDVDAIRNPEVTRDNVTAGIRLRGEAQRPKVTIYSEPSLSQQEAISYLLRGRSLGDSSGSSQDTMVATMLIGAGIGQSEGTISELGSTFGIKEMAVDTSGEGSDTKVRVSGYVLPGVQVGYGVGVFFPITVISLRYEILPKLILEATDGLQSAVDLLYEFEF